MLNIFVETILFLGYLNTLGYFRILFLTLYFYLLSHLINLINTC